MGLNHINFKIQQNFNKMTLKKDSLVWFKLLALEKYVQSGRCRQV